jgi:hypothetical protein
MTSLVFFIESISTGLYIIGAGGLLWMAYRFLRARRELAIAQFKLEREHALVRRASAITIGGLLVEFLIAVWAISTLVAPTLREIRVGDGEANAGAPRAFITSTPVANAPVNLNVNPLEQQGDQIFSTPPPTATPVGTIIPDMPAAVGCPEDAAWIHSPGNGQLVFEATTVWGTASISNFSFYRFEIKRTEPGSEFAPIGEYTEPVVNGPLGDLLPLNFERGDYRFRLTVFDNTQTLVALCEISIRISDPPPTPTPLAPAGQVVSPTPTIEGVEGLE